MAPIATLTVKLQAQIAEFQKEFQEATKSAEKFQNEFQASATKASAIGNIIAQGVVGAVRALGELAQAVANNASNIVDLSQKTGLSMATIQRFQHVAEQTGSSVEAFSNAAFQLGARLAGNNTSVKKAVDDLGLSFEQLKTLKPDQQFEQIATALGNMTNAQERNRIGLALFGRNFKDIASAVSEGYKKLADDANVATDDQIKALEKLGDEWDKFQRNQLTRATAVAGSFVLMANAAKNGGLIETLKNIAIEGGNVGAALERMALKAQALKTFRVDIELPALPTKQTEDYTAALAAARVEVSGLTKEQKAQIVAGRALGESAQNIADRVGVSEAALRLFTTTTKGATKGTKELTESWQTLLKRIEGTVLLDVAKDWEKALSNVGAKAKLLSDTALRKEMVEALTKVEQKFGSLEKAGVGSLRDVFEAARILTDEIEKIPISLDAMSSQILQLLPSFRASLAENLEREFQRIIDSGALARNAIAAAKDAGKKAGEAMAQEWSRALQLKEDLKIEARRAAENTVQALANAFETGDWDQFQRDISKIIGDFIGGAIAAGVDFLVPGLGQMLRPLFNQLGRALTNLFDRNRGRDLVEDFANSLGGFDVLQKKLMELGEEGGRLWKMLTQGVGRNNPEQARAAIEAVTAALDRHEGRLASATAVLAEFGLTWEDAGQKFKNQTIADAFTTLFEKTQTLKDIGVDYNLILEKQAAAYSELVQAAIRTGSEIPLAMRPILEDLVKMGLLTRADGTAFEDLSDVTWAKTLTQGFRDVTDAIHELTDVIRGKLKGALDDIGSRRIEIPIGFRVEQPNLSLDIGDEAGFPRLASGGIVRRATLALLGESGPEAVVPLNQLSNVAPAEGSTTIILEADGRALAEVTVPHIPGVVRRYGLV